MKKKQFSVMTVVLCATLLSSCGNSNSANDKAVSDADSVSVPKKVMTHVKVAGDFYQITNIGSVDVVFSEGDYKIDVECDSSLLPYVSTTFDSGTLTVFMRREEKGEVEWAGKSNATLYVSCPLIKYIAVCGGGSFKSVGTIHSTDMQIGNLGTGNIELDSVVCETFEHEHRTDANAVFKHVTCERAKLLSYGSGTIQSDIDAGSIYAVIGGEGDMECNFRSDDVEISSFSSGDAAFNLDCKQLNVSHQGTGKIVLNGHSEQKLLKAGRKAVMEDNLR
ncbi:MAG: DUF2807 domain-containing protein [Prevotellaceae bacterium]|nr:DUF2807 domain-containing protein [Prevotellaceae bacterium]